MYIGRACCAERVIHWAQTEELIVVPRIRAHPMDSLRASFLVALITQEAVAGRVGNAGKVRL